MTVNSPGRNLRSPRRPFKTLSPVCPAAANEAAARLRGPAQEPRDEDAEAASRGGGLCASPPADTNERIDWMMAPTACDSASFVSDGGPPSGRHLDSIPPDSITFNSRPVNSRPVNNGVPVNVDAPIGGIPSSGSPLKGISLDAVPVDKAENKIQMNGGYDSGSSACPLYELDGSEGYEILLACHEGVHEGISGPADVAAAATAQKLQAGGNRAALSGQGTEADDGTDEQQTSQAEMCGRMASEDMSLSRAAVRGLTVARPPPAPELAASQRRRSTSPETSTGAAPAAAKMMDQHSAELVDEAKQEGLGLELALEGLGPKRTEEGSALHDVVAAQCHCHAVEHAAAAGAPRGSLSSPAAACGPKDPQMSEPKGTGVNPLRVTEPRGDASGGISPSEPGGAPPGDSTAGMAGTQGRCDLIFEPEDDVFWLFNDTAALEGSGGGSGGGGSGGGSLQGDWGGGAGQADSAERGGEGSEMGLSSVLGLEAERRAGRKRLHAALRGSFLHVRLSRRA